MSIDWSTLVGRTTLKNQDCVILNLDRMKILNQQRLQNLPGTHGRPFFCGNGVHEVVSQLNAAIKDEAASIPVIDRAKMPEPLAEPVSEPVTQEVLLSELDLDGVSEVDVTRLAEAGIVTVGDALRNEGEHILEVPTFGEAKRDRVVSAVKAALEA